MTDSAGDEADTHKLACGLTMALLAIGSVWLGFQVGHLGQQVRRAHELLRSMRGSAGATEFELIAESLLDVSHSIFAVRLWLFLVGVFALTVVAVLDWAAIRVRAAAAALVLMCWAALLLTTSIQ